MTRVTGKFQITLPKRLVDAYGIRVGDEVEIVAAGQGISIIPARASKALAPQERLRLFDEATRRQSDPKHERPLAPTKDRGWTREDLYDRGRTR